MANLSHTLRRGAMLPLITNGGPHPCIMLTDIYEMIGEGGPSIIQVHLTSSKNRNSPYYDPTCLFKARWSGADAGSAARRGEGGPGAVQAGDDPLITKDCWVFYLRAQVREVADIEGAVGMRGCWQCGEAG